MVARQAVGYAIAHEARMLRGRIVYAHKSGSRGQPQPARAVGIHTIDGAHGRAILLAEKREPTLLVPGHSSHIKGHPDIARAIFGKCHRRQILRDPVLTFHPLKAFLPANPADQSAIRFDGGDPDVAAGIFEHSENIVARKPVAAGVYSFGSGLTKGLCAPLREPAHALAGCDPPVAGMVLK